MSNIKVENLTSAGAGAAAVAGFNTSSHVYVLSEQHAWVPARLLELNESSGKASVSVSCFSAEQAIVDATTAGSKKMTVQTVNLSDYPASALPLQNVDSQGRLRTVPDMVDLPFLHEVGKNEGADNAFVLPVEFAHMISSPYAGCWLYRLPFCTI